MVVALPAVPLTGANQSAQLPEFCRDGGNLRLANESPYLLQISHAGDTVWLDAWSADILPLVSGQRFLSIVPSLLIPNQPIPSASLLMTFATPESKIPGTYPVAFSRQAGSLISGLSAGDLGSGADGAVTIAGSTTLTADQNYSSLVVNAGGILNTQGFVVRCTGALTNNGTIRNNGGDGGAAGASTAGTAGTAAPGGSLGAGGKGGTGPTLPTAPAVASVSGGAGGAGGNVASAGQAGATVPLNPPGAIALASFRTLSYGGGAGGGHGGGSGTGTGANGGGGGGGGGVLVIAGALAGSGAFQALGGAAGAGFLGTDTFEGGSGGGGGGTVLVLCQGSTFTGTLSAAGGAASAGLGTGAAGIDGRPGPAGLVVA